MSGNRSHKKPSTTPTLSKQQTKAIINDSQRVLVLAGAGAGKPKPFWRKSSI
ncbi:MAG: hypothetical protein IPL46_26210 [Saprospiraceae bacterium]|nr:hypothetical protein [Saprospiraceae bacterium]